MRVVHFKYSIMFYVNTYMIYNKRDIYRIVIFSIKYTDNIVIVQLNILFFVVFLII